MLALLAEREINTVWVEAGRTLCGALLAAGLIDELIVYSAPIVLGEDALGMFGVGGMRHMNQRYEFVIDAVERCGSDLRVTYRPSTVATSASAP